MTLFLDTTQQVLYGCAHQLMQRPGALPAFSKKKYKAGSFFQIQFNCSAVKHNHNRTFSNDIWPHNSKS
jgi:hypothetical protein